MNTKIKNRVEDRETTEAASYLLSCKSSLFEKGSAVKGMIFFVSWQIVLFRIDSCWQKRQQEFWHSFLPLKWIHSLLYFQSFGLYWEEVENLMPTNFSSLFDFWIHAKWRKPQQEDYWQEQKKGICYSSNGSINHANCQLSKDVEKLITLLSDQNTNHHKVLI